MNKEQINIQGIVRKYTINLANLREKLNNPDFKGVEFAPFKNELNKIALSQMKIMIESKSIKQLK